MTGANEVKVVCQTCAGSGGVSYEGAFDACPDDDLPGIGYYTATLVPGERSRIYREELEKVVAGLELLRDGSGRVAFLGTWVTLDHLRAALLPPEGK